MEQKIILITGATDGIGKVAAMELAKQGHQVILHGRNPEKTQKIVTEIKEATGNQTIDYLIADLFSLKAIQAMAVAFNQKYDHLDVLINNAGAVLDNQRFETGDGLEGTMALNVIAPFLLNLLLLPRLQQSRSARIINTSSASHRTIRSVDLNDLNVENIPSAQSRYALSKLYVIWLTRHLAMYLRQQGIMNVTVNTSHPGAVATNFGQDSEKGWLTNLIYKVALPFMASPEKGAATNVFLATDASVEGVSGKYFGNQKEEQPSERCYSEENEQLVWEYCMKICQPYLSEGEV